MALGTGVGAVEVPLVTEDTAVPARKVRKLRIPRSPKVLVGAGMLVFFVLLAVINVLERRTKRALSAE